MNRIASTTLCVALILAALPAAAETIKRRLPAGDAPELRIINAVGDIVVRGERTDAIDIVADLGRDVERLDVTERGNVVVIESIYEGQGWRSDGTDLVVTVPEGGSVSVEAVSADVKVLGVRGQIRVSSVSGDVDVETFGGRLDAVSTSGDVTVVGHNEAGEARLGSTSGDIDVRGLSGRLEAVAVSGDVTVAEGVFDRVRAQTTSGDVTLLRMGGEDPDLKAGAVSGDVTVVLGADFGGRIDVSTLNGRIDNCFGPKAQRTSRYGPGRTLNFDHGNGRGRVEIETVNGGVDLCIE